MSIGSDSTAFQAAFRDNDRELRLRHARVGCWLALVLMPAGSTLDLVVYPDLFWPILEVRWITNVFIAAVLALLATPFGKRNVAWLGSAWVFMPAIAIAWMIAVSEGTFSPYYAGLCLVIIIGCLLMPYTLVEAATVCGIVMGLYLAACLVHPDSRILSSIFYNNCYFIVLTATIAAVSCHYYHRRRVEDFRLRHELDARNRELAELDRLKSEFFANISHELRTPLTLILGPVEEIMREPGRLARRDADALQLVRQNTLRLLHMINDLLELVRVDARRSGPDRLTERVDLARLLPGIVDSVHHLAKAKGVDLRLQGARQDASVGNTVILGDTAGLEKVFLNLLTNAVKFTPDKGRITVRLARESEFATVSVVDTGIGIAPEHLPHIFDRFRQVDGSTTRRFRGLGLGLALVKELVDEHHGQLTVDSTPGRGTTFVVRLPLVAGEAAAPVTVEPHQPDPTVQTLKAADEVGVVSQGEVASLAETGSGEHLILVVDDEPDMRRFIVSILADDYRILQAVDGETGLAMAIERQPDLIVLDMMLPGLDGLEVCRRMRLNKRLDDTRIIMLTARADEQTKLTALRHGADDFLTKPFSSVEVRTRITNLLRTLTLQRDLRKHNTELTQTIRELNATRARLIQSEKMNSLGSLAAGLLHEINNPLNYALTALQLLDESVTDSDRELKETLDDVSDGMFRIRDIITSLRTFAYPTSNENRQRVDLQAVVDTALRFTSHQRSGIDVRVELDDEATAWGSEVQLTQVLVNLLSNAIRAVESVAPQRSPRIVIRGLVRDDRCVIVVQDNGVGIEPDAIGRIFDPFYTTQDVGKGIGLGLSVCHTIVTNHGGSMTVRSEKDAWTEVEVDLPAEQPETLITHGTNE